MDANSSLHTFSPADVAPSFDQSPWASRWIAVALSLLVIVVSTRVVSGSTGGSKTLADGTKTVPMVPYWFPILGHVAQMTFAPESLWRWTRETYQQGIFALNLGGTTHSFIFHPPLGATLMNQKTSVADAESVSKYLMHTNFAFPKAELETKYDAALHDILDCYKHLLGEPSLGTMVRTTASLLKRNIVDLVTFSASRVDQTLWERISNVKTVTTPTGERVVEASLLPLLREFVAHTANPSLVGPDFLNNFPDYFSHLWIMDWAFFLLATGMPRWIPWPSLTRAHIANRRMLAYCCAYETAFEKKLNGEDPGFEWQNVDDASPLMHARQRAYRKHDFSIKARAACDMALIWSMNANANPLIFWMVNRIYADADLLARIRDEVAPYAVARQPPSTLPIAESPRLDTLDDEALLTKCPLLKAAYIECLRLDTGPWSFKIMRQDLVLSGRGEPDKYLIKAGTYAHIAHELHHTNPACFDDPMVWRAERHIQYEEPETQGGERHVVADMGSIRPYGGGASMCKGRAFAAKEALMFTAAIVTFWDIEMAGGGPWKMPKPKAATGTRTTRDDVRVWLRRRAVPMG